MCHCRVHCYDPDNLVSDGPEQVKAIARELSGYLVHGDRFAESRLALIYTDTRIFVGLRQQSHDIPCDFPQGLSIVVLRNLLI